MRLLPLVIALGMVAPGRARAKPRGAEDNERGRPPRKQGRRRADRSRPRVLAPLRSPCGRHVVSVDGGAVVVDGRRVHPELGTVEVLQQPAWRADGNALAWIERHRGETRLVVLPTVASEPLAWVVPGALASDRVHWAGDARVVLGPRELEPRAVASWTE